MVERLVANEKVEGSTPFARSKIIVIKSKFITNTFQKFLRNKDIRIYKKSLFYYFIFRIIRNFLLNDIIVKIYNFEIYGSINKKNTSYYLLKKCEFGDDYEMDILKLISNKNEIFLIDCGCNYGFYSFYVASLARKNFVLSIEASKKTSNYFLKNYELNELKNISFFNKAISDEDEKLVDFNESENDWESSLAHDNFELKSIDKIKTCKIDTIVKNHDLKNYILFIKLDIEGNEMSAIKGALKTIEEFTPIIIIEFSKYIFDNQKNINYLKTFLDDYDYQIYDVKKKIVTLENIMINIGALDENHKTIGNYFLLKNNSKQLKLFQNNE